jgi:NADP-dependent aldehyde dehydrogenase
LELGSKLIDRAVAETGLPETRFIGERGRTIAQLRMFAELVEEGSWVEARIDTAIPDREPLPKPDLRQMLVPVGPVVIFGASNFPLAFSVPGGDTASALAAGNPVIVKAHPAHPGTSELVAGAIERAVSRCGIPPGFFSMLHGASYEVGLAMVRHPKVEAVGFTGSLAGGRALFDEAASRPRPIPVFAEMGSINPVFVLPSALRERAEELARSIHQSMTLGVGQFCTSPGLVVGLRCQGLDDLLEFLGKLTADCAPATMLHPGIREAYLAGVEALTQKGEVQLISCSSREPDPVRTEVAVNVFLTDAETFVKQRELSDEVFGPSTLVVACESTGELESIAEKLEGHLTATIQGTPQELSEHRSLVTMLESKVGRLIFNGVPTGVEVCPSMHHGGPYPATTDARYTSVGTNAIKRFARPACFQDFPQSALPAELKDQNEKGIWRLINGSLDRDSI